MKNPPLILPQYIRSIFGRESWATGVGISALPAPPPKNDTATMKFIMINPYFEMQKISWRFSINHQGSDHALPQAGRQLAGWTVDISARPNVKNTSNGSRRAIHE
ncbi:hypothetical protein [Paludibacterium paludis]|uniref:hypothetical protein n=1 Tax=Paludibacterium paludis TaxID=1225769 RepID=UPI001C03C7E7|nr:hypothetical protein [Paludibacterium paludis]